MPNTNAPEQLLARALMRIDTALTYQQALAHVRAAAAEDKAVAKRLRFAEPNPHGAPVAAATDVEVYGRRVVRVTGDADVCPFTVELAARNMVYDADLVGVTEPAVLADAHEVGPFLRVLPSDGFPYEVVVNVGSDGTPVVEIDTSEASEAGRFHDADGVPYLRVWVNEHLVDGNDIDEPQARPWLPVGHPARNG